MRSLAWVAVLLLMGGSAGAAVTVAPFVAPDDLVVFAPEVSRVFVSSLERAGVDVVASHGVTVAGKIEALGRERVRLKASIAGRSVEVEGELERIDRLVRELANALVAVMPAKARGGSGAASAKAAATPAKPEAVPSARPSASAEESDPPAVKPDESVSHAREVTPDEPRLVSVGPESGSSSSAPAPAAAAAVVPSRPAVASSTSATSASSSGAPSRASDYAGRAVLHSVNTPQGCSVGSLGTRAAYDFLDRRLRVKVVSIGPCGYLPAANAGIEAGRLGVSSVVMLWFDSLALEPAASGFRAVGQLRVMVVRDGRQVLHRAIRPLSRAVAGYDLQRSAYDLVTDGLNAISSDLASVLRDAR